MARFCGFSLRRDGNRNEVKFLNKIPCSVRIGEIYKIFIRSWNIFIVLNVRQTGDFNILKFFILILQIRGQITDVSISFWNNETANGRIRVDFEYAMFAYFAETKMQQWLWYFEIFLFVFWERIVSIKNISFKYKFHKNI